jgi:hypothetical protein
MIAHPPLPCGADGLAQDIDPHRHPDSVAGLVHLSWLWAKD